LIALWYEVMTALFQSIRSIIPFSYSSHIFPALRVMWCSRADGGSSIAGVGGWDR